MDASLPYCGCWRLLRALEDEDLPDHVCWEIAAENVGRWLVETLAGREADRADAFYDPMTTADDDVSDEVRDAATRVGFQPNWPLRVDGRYLVLVLRQWVQEPPNPTLAVQLRGLPAWLEVVERYRSVHARWRAHPDGQGDEQNYIWISDPDRVWRALGADRGDPPERVMALRLRQAGLPDTPRTMRHLRAVVAGSSDPLPSRGELVTTQVLMQGRQVERDGVERLGLDNPTTRTTVASSELETGPLQDQVNIVKRRHRDWCQEQLGRNPLTDRGAIRAAQPGAFVVAEERRPPHAMDFYVEGVKRLADLLDSLCHAPVMGENRDGMITDYLDKVFRRVYNKHQRAYQKALKRAAATDVVPPPPKAPAGWRDDFRAILNDGTLKAMLDASGGVPPPALRSALKQYAAALAARL